MFEMGSFLNVRHEAAIGATLGATLTEFIEYRTLFQMMILKMFNLKNHHQR